MAFCSNCGAQVAGGFCANCGTPAGGGAAEAAANPVSAQAGGLSTNAASALCYLFGFITGIIFLVLGPYNQNKTVRFHAFQSIFLGVAVVAIGILLSILTAITGFAFFLFPIFWLACFIVWLYMLFSTYSGKNVNLPVIGEFAQKQA
jgi:uncharacterized membrane protein